MIYDQLRRLQVMQGTGEVAYGQDHSRPDGVHSWPTGVAYGTDRSRPEVGCGAVLSDECRDTERC